VAAAGVLCCAVAAFGQPESRPGTGTAEEIGSTRGARVARAVQPGERLTFLMGEVPEERLAELERIAPNVRFITGLNRQSAMEHAGEAHGVDARFASPEFIEKAPNLVWVQSMSAGVDRFRGNKPLMENNRIVPTNMRAVHGPAIADHAMAMLLTLTRNMRFYERARAEGKWAEEGPPGRGVVLQGKTMLVVGIGGIGTEIAQRAHGFGMRVIATRRSETPAPAYVEKVGKPGDLMAMLPEADVVAVCVPLTAETEGLIGEEALAAIKPGAYLINIARGRIVDTDALLKALDSGRLAGACLDVTDPEPLPEGHPLWKQKNVIITPHIAADGELTEERAMALFAENLRRFGAGEPLLNCVDKRAGY
jgi:phosphoglycerate dehydrogenase-like enzyme